MRMAAFIRANSKPIIKEWEYFASTLVPPAGDVTPLALRNHIAQLLDFIASDIDSAQTKTEQVEKSRGEKAHPMKTTAAETHASLRHAGGFNMDQMVSEYRALRASVVKLWTAQMTEPSVTDVTDLTRFNEAIDQALMESIHDYTEKLDNSRHLFLGILGHDLRNPLGAILMSSQLMLRIGKYGARETMLLGQVKDSADRANEIITHLLDLTRSRLGSGIPIIPEPADLGFICRKIVDEMRVLRPDREFQLSISEDLEGKWDKARLAQVLSNLLSNALQYGFKSSPIRVMASGTEKDVILAVRNDGVPIAPGMIDKIFESLTRAEDEDVADPEKPSDEPVQDNNLGLGLYISRQVIVAHGGTLTVTSTEKDGTTFTAKFPREM